MSKNNDDRRPVEGRLWGASTNLNQTNMVIKETSGNYLYLEMNIEQLPFVKRITEVMNKITNEVELLPGTLYVWNKNIFKYLPITIREEFLERVKVLRKNDVPQKLIEVESIYN
jgi:excinuclease UvrABC helicase subunit UvrB